MVVGSPQGGSAQGGSSKTSLLGMVRPRSRAARTCWQGTAVGLGRGAAQAHPLLLTRACACTPGCPLPQRYLRTQMERSTLVVVSHDRAFLNAVAQVHLVGWLVGCLVEDAGTRACAACHACTVADVLGRARPRPAPCRLFIPLQLRRLSFSRSGNSVTTREITTSTSSRQDGRPSQLQGPGRAASLPDSCRHHAQRSSGPCGALLPPGLHCNQFGRADACRYAHRLAGRGEAAAPAAAGRRH